MQDAGCRTQDVFAQAIPLACRHPVPESQRNLGPVDLHGHLVQLSVPLDRTVSEAQGSICGPACPVIPSQCRAGWGSTREGQLGSDADADKAESRFKCRLAAYRARRAAPPVEWQVPGTRLAEVLAAAPEVADPGHRQAMD
jgi:hypothetical protein